MLADCSCVCVWNGRRLTRPFSRRLNFLHETCQPFIFPPGHQYTPPPPRPPCSLFMHMYLLLSYLSRLTRKGSKWQLANNWEIMIKVYLAMPVTTATVSHISLTTDVFWIFTEFLRGLSNFKWKYTVKLQIFVRYLFSYFRLETGSYVLIFVLPRVCEENYVEIQWLQSKKKFSYDIKFRTFSKVRNVRK